MHVARFATPLVFTLAALAMGCGAHRPPREPVGNARGALGGCGLRGGGNGCTNSNGDGVHVAAGDAAGLRVEGAPTWHLLGLTSGPEAVVVHGWYEGHGAADARVAGARIDGRDVRLRALRAEGSALTAEVEGGASIADRDLGGLVLSLRVPSADGGAERHVSLRLGASQPLAGRFDDVIGRGLELRDDDAKDPSFTGYCRSAGGDAMPAVLAEGVQWAVADGARTRSASRVGVACESGAVATCMRWGYRPWASAEGPNGPVSLADHHQACVHMKRAAYLGDARSFTTPGTKITFADGLAAPIERADVGVVEAAWNADGATCVSAPRARRSGFDTTAAGLPTCAPGAAYGKALLLSGTPR